MQVEKGQLVEITGWVRIDEPITAQRRRPADCRFARRRRSCTLTVDQTSGWQPFQIVRGVPESTDLRLTFALTGIGTAHIDGVMVRTLQQPVARRLPPVGTAATDSPAILAGVFLGTTELR